MANLQKQGARKPMVSNSAAWAEGGYDHEKHEPLFGIGFRGDDTKYYTLTLSPAEMLFVVGEWLKRAGSEYTLSTKVRLP